MVVMRRILGLNRAILGTGEFDIKSFETNLGTEGDVFWDRRSQISIIIRLIMGHNNVTFWDRRS